MSHAFYSHATDYLWQSVNLMDKWHLHVDADNNNVWGDRGRGVSDEVSAVQRLFPNCADSIQPTSTTTRPLSRSCTY